MILTLENGKQIDTAQPLDISIELNEHSTTAWYVPPVKIVPVTGENFTGKVSEGGSVNFNNISFNPHGNGTHTECVGHITPKFYSINDCLTQFHFNALLISIVPSETNGDKIITQEQIEEKLTQHNSFEALIIRTLPNSIEKTIKNRSNTNWTYLSESTMTYIRERGINHLLIDTPSVDKEDDGGKLLAHKAFWNYPNATRKNATITEMVYIPDEIKDGAYLLNLQISSFKNDASPSKPVLYEYL